MPFQLTEQDIEDFQRDGAVCLRGFFSREWLDKARVGIEKTLARPSQYSECLKGGTGDGMYFNDYCNWQDIPEFRDLVYHSPASQIAGKLMKSKTAVFYHEHVLTKDPGTYKVTPWHHDQPYYPIDGDQNCSIWFSIDPVPEETTIEFVQGSHRWGRWFHPTKFASETNYVIDDDEDTGHAFEEIPDFDAQREKYGFLKWAVEPGDCVVFHMKCVHGAPANKTSSPRRVVSLRWLGDDCTLAKRPWKVSPPICGGLNYGDRVVCDTFPLVWKERTGE